MHACMHSKYRFTIDTWFIHQVSIANRNITSIDLQSICNRYLIYTPSIDWRNRLDIGAPYLILVK